MTSERRQPPPLEQQGTALARDAGREIGEKARETRNDLADQVRTLGTAVRRATQELRQDDRMGLADRAERLGAGLERASEYVRNRSPRELKEEVEHYARREPARFLGGAFVLGFLGARFLKSSAPPERREEPVGSGEEMAMAAQHPSGAPYPSDAAQYPSGMGGGQGSGHVPA